MSITPKRGIMERKGNGYISTPKGEKMRKRRMGKRTIVGLFVVTVAIGITGCKSQVVVEVKEDSFTYELGQLSKDPKEYLEITPESEYANVSMDWSSVKENEPGTYQVSASLEDKKYPITIILQDTIAPEIIVETDTFKTEQGLTVTKEELLENAHITVTDAGSTHVDIMRKEGTASINGDEISFPYTEEGIFSIVATDQAGNQGSVDISYQAGEPTIPELQGLEEDGIFYIAMGNSDNILESTDLSVVGYDAKDGELPVTVDESGVNKDEEGDYKITFKVEDSDGRITEQQSDVKVVDMSMIDSDDKLTLYLLEPEEYADVEWSDEYRKKCFTSDGRLMVYLMDPDNPADYYINEIEKETCYTKSPVTLFNEPDVGSGQVGMVDAGKEVTLSAMSTNAYGRIEYDGMEGYVFITELTNKRPGSGGSGNSESVVQAPSEQPQDPGSEEVAVHENGYRTDLAQAMFSKINEYRVSCGVQELTWDDTLAGYANTRASELVISNSHTRPDGTSFHSLSGNDTGENISTSNYEDYEEVEVTFNAWKNSAGHNENMLNSAYGSTGIGCYYENGMFYWSQIFKLN